MSNVAGSQYHSYDSAWLTSHSTTSSDSEYTRESPKEQTEPKEKMKAYITIIACCLFKCFAFARTQNNISMPKEAAFFWLRAAVEKVQPEIEAGFDRGTGALEKEGYIIDSGDSGIYTFTLPYGWETRTGILCNCVFTLVKDDKKATMAGVYIDIPLSGSPKEVGERCGMGKSDFLFKLLSSKDVSRQLGKRKRIRGIQIGLSQLSYSKYPDKCFVYSIRLRCGPAHSANSRDEASASEIVYYIPTTAFPRELNWGQKVLPATAPETVPQDCFSDFRHLNEEGLQFVLSSD